jgi:hypothetical protein
LLSASVGCVFASMKTRVRLHRHIRHFCRGPVLLLGLLFSGFAQADPMELKVDRHVIEREDRLNRPRIQAEEQTTELRVSLTNKSGKTTAELVVEWELVVLRGGVRDNLLVKGRKTQAAVENAQTVTVITDAVPVVKARTGKQDLEYRITVREAGKNGKELASKVSTKEFDQVVATAVEEGKKKKKKDKN